MPLGEVLYVVGIDEEVGGNVVISPAGTFEKGEPGADVVYGDGGPVCPKLI
jgi:hypothetical protein